MLNAAYRYNLPKNMIIKSDKFMKKIGDENSKFEALPSSGTLDIGQILDGETIHPIQIFGVILAALAAAMDGFDGQLIGFAIPSILREWHLTREAVSPVVAAGLLGMVVGSVSISALADSYGRRFALIASITFFGILTVITGFSNNIELLTILRFFSGLGIGGALPCASIIAVEFFPARVRTIAVTATVVCYPIGGILSGLFSAHVLPTSDWHALFYLGGAFPIIFAFVLLVALPESPRYLARRLDRQTELRRFLLRVRGPIPDKYTIVDSVAEFDTPHVRLTDLYSRKWRRDSLALSISFFMCLLALFSVFSWLPALLVSEGMDIRTSSEGLTAYNIGGLFGALMCAVVIAKIGSRWALLGAAFGGMLSAVLLLDPLSRMGTIPLIIGIGVHGFFVNAVQGPMYALGAYIYPTEMRVRGIGVATGFGRLGAIVSAFVGAIVISRGGATAYFGLLAAAMLVVLVGLGTVRRHIPARPRNTSVTAATISVE
jgi:MFS transporter, AAHS family, 4-hydroxybenzoate transporter